jgi:hydroxyacylglutathione hydrolase
LILQRVEQSDWLSNAYLAVDRPGGSGVLIDSNGVTDPLVERAEREGTKISHLLLTHSHLDHVAEARELAERVGAKIVAHPEAVAQLEWGVDAEISGGDVIEVGELRIEAIDTPGHTAGHLAFLIDGSDCVTADCLFKGTVGGTKAPGATGFDDLRRSIMERLMELPQETRIHPGHREPSTIGAEWEANPFIRIWRGIDEEGTDGCSVGSGDSEAKATLVLWAPDYDGGNKAWVRFADGSDEIVGGSQVQRGT